MCVCVVFVLSLCCCFCFCCWQQHTILPKQFAFRLLLLLSQQNRHTQRKKKKTKYRNPKLCMIHNFHSAQSSGICIAVPTTTEQRTTILKCNFLNRIAYWKNSVLKTKFCYATQHHLTQTKIARRKWKETLKLPQKLCVMTRENKFWLCDADAAVSVAPKNQLSRRSLYFASRGQSSTSIVVSSTSNNKHTHTHNCRPIHRLPLLVQPK